MAKLVPLPPVSELPKVVIFHRAHPSEPVLVMQVPTGDTDDFQTYRLRMDNTEHKRWLSRLPDARNLTYKLTCELHLAYFPHDGGQCLPMEDAEEPSRLMRVMADMRSKPSPEKVSTMFRRRRQRTPGISRLRQHLTRRTAKGGRL